MLGEVCILSLSTTNILQTYRDIKVKCLKYEQNSRDCFTISNKQLEMKLLKNETLQAKKWSNYS